MKRILGVRPLSNFIFIKQSKYLRETNVIVISKTLQGRTAKKNRSNSAPPRPLPLRLVSPRTVAPLPVLPDGSQGSGEIEALAHRARPPRPSDPRRRGSAQAEACHSRRRRRHLVRPPQPQPPLELGPLRCRGRGGGLRGRGGMDRRGGSAQQGCRLRIPARAGPSAALRGPRPHRAVCPLPGLAIW